MKKSREMKFVKSFAIAIIIPVFMLACVIVKVVLSQVTDHDFAVSRALVQSEQKIRTQEWFPKHRILATDSPETEVDNNHQRQSSAAVETHDTVKDNLKLNLLLISVFSGSPVDAMALIKDLESNSVGVYKIDQQIGTGRITGIRKNRVVVVDHGRRLILRPVFDHPCNFVVPEDVARADVQKTRRIPIGSPPVAETYEDYQTPVASLKSVLRRAKLEPFLLNGQIQGLRVSDLNNILVAKEMDIRQGDIIHSINGHLLINEQQAWQVLKKAKSLDIIDVEVLYND